MLLWYFLNEFEMIPLDSIITVITFVFFFLFHILCITIVKLLYFRIFSASFFITFLSPETSVNMCSYFIITDYDDRLIFRDCSFRLLLLNQ